MDHYIAWCKGSKWFVSMAHRGVPAGFVGVFDGSRARQEAELIATQLNAGDMSLQGAGITAWAPLSAESPLPSSAQADSALLGEQPALRVGAPPELIEAARQQVLRWQRMLAARMKDLCRAWRDRGKPAAS